MGEWSMYVRSTAALESFHVTLCLCSRISSWPTISDQQRQAKGVERSWIWIWEIENMVGINKCTVHTDGSKKMNTKC